MLETIVGALLPIVITMLLGYLAARHHDFGAQEASILIRMVMTYALPVSLFVGTVSRTRDALLQDLTLLIVLTVAIVGLYGVVLLVCRGALRLSLGRSALAALAASAPNVGVVGPTVLGSLYGAASGLPVAIGNLVIVMTVIPLTVILLSVDADEQASPPDQSFVPSSAPASSPAAASRAAVAGKIVAALTQPIVWLPLLGVLLVLGGRSLPVLLIDALTLLGQSASGVALFAAGIILAVHTVRVTSAVVALAVIKNIVQPALVWVSLLLLGYHNPLLGEAVVTAALPMLVAVAILAVQYQVAEEEAASTLFLSIGSSLVTVAGFIALTGA
jgi:malonate transporter and related proteins